jgi:hypothetical protein
MALDKVPGTSTNGRSDGGQDIRLLPRLGKAFACMGHGKAEVHRWCLV